MSVAVGYDEPKAVVEKELGSLVRFDNTIHRTGQDLVTGVGVHVNHLVVHAIDVSERGVKVKDDVGRGERRREIIEIVTGRRDRSDTRASLV